MSEIVTTTLIMVPFFLGVVLQPDGTRRTEKIIEENFAFEAAGNVTLFGTLQQIRMRDSAVALISEIAPNSTMQKLKKKLANRNVCKPWRKIRY